MELIRFTDEEVKNIKVEQQANGVVTYSYPSNLKGFGNLEVKMEDADAQAVLNVLEKWETFKPSDFHWLSQVTDGLEG